MTNKSLIIAISEFTTLVRSKAFIVGLLMMPVFSLVAVGVQKFTRDATDLHDRRFAVVDRSGVLYGPIKAAADEWNAAARARGTQTAPLFLPEAATFEDDDAQARAALSDRVRRDEIYAFVEIPAGVQAPESNAEIRYYSNHPAYRALPGWIATIINREIVNRRFRAAAVDRALVARLTRRVDLAELGLVERDTRGAVKAAAPIDKVRTLAIPVAMMMIVLFSVMSGAPQLLNSVIEEKMSRISEVLIGSVTPYELMMGKLAGCIAVSLVLASVYIVAGTGAARHFGYGDAIHGTDIAWLFLFLLLASFMFGSVFITIGAACSDLKDAQGMMPPAMLVLMLPWLTWFAVLNAPDSPIAIGLSLLPTATPFLMLLRIMLPPGPPLWQIGLSVGLTAAATIAMVYAAGKIFRTGLLMQGKGASFAEMWRWVRTD
ncbi:MAG TPA: ABC transporter permease [Vicinamibacterales bacterium]|jgi:ABC-2 type transport system permease protein